MYGGRKSYGTPERTCINYRISFSYSRSSYHSTNPNVIRCQFRAVLLIYTTSSAQSTRDTIVFLSHCLKVLLLLLVRKNIVSLTGNLRPCLRITSASKSLDQIDRSNHSSKLLDRTTRFKHSIKARQKPTWGLQ